MSDRIELDDLEVGAPAPKPFPGTPKSPQEALEAIAKLTRALEAGYANAAPGASQEGRALRVESLDCTMKLVTFSDKHPKLEKAVRGKDAKIMFNGKELKGFKGDFTYEYTPFERIRADDVDSYRFVTMAVAAPRKNVIIADLDCEAVVTGGSTLTKAMVEDAARQARDNIMLPDRLIVAPAVYATYEGGCYVCAHPKKVSYPHRVHKMRFCLDCCAHLASD